MRRFLIIFFVKYVYIILISFLFISGLFLVGHEDFRLIGTYLWSFLILLLAIGVYVANSILDNNDPNTDIVDLVDYYLYMFKIRKTAKPFIMTVELGHESWTRSHFCLPIKIGEKDYAFNIKITSMEDANAKPRKLKAIIKPKRYPYMYVDFNGMARVEINGKCPYIKTFVDEYDFLTSLSDIKKIKTIEQWGTGIREDAASIKRSGIKINATDKPNVKTIF